MRFPIEPLREPKEEFRDAAVLLNQFLTMRGTLAERPAEGTGGMYIATDTNQVLYYGDDQLWREVTTNTVIP